jgi:glycosyltransferase involved in cell wall biosynthesis
VVFWGRKRQAEMPAYFNASDVMIVSLCDQPVLALTVPAKFQAYLAFSKPVFAVMNGEVRRVVEEYRTGLYARPDSPEAIRDGFLLFYELRGEGLEEFSSNSKALLDRVYNRTKIIDGLTGLLRA